MTLQKLYKDAVCEIREHFEGKLEIVSISLTTVQNTWSSDQITYAVNYFIRHNAKNIHRNISGNSAAEVIEKIKTACFSELSNIKAELIKPDSDIEI